MTPLQINYPVSVAILYADGDSEDLKDTRETVEQVTNALQNRGHIVRSTRVMAKNWRKEIRIPGQVVFNMAEDSEWDLYMKIGIALERMGRAQVGHDRHTFDYVINKERLKNRLQKLGLPTPQFRVFNRRSKLRQIRGLEYPLMVKPVKQHAGIGISQDSVVIDEKELVDRVKYLFANFPGEVLAEEFVDGKEVDVTLLGNGKHVVALPITELKFTGEFKDNWNIYDYEAKWEDSSWKYWNVKLHSPALLDSKLERKLVILGKQTFSWLECRDFIRLDVRLDEKDRPFIVDVNMNPSLAMHELEATWRSANALGWSYEDLIETIVAITYKRVYGKLPDRIRERQLLLSAAE